MVNTIETVQGIAHLNDIEEMIAQAIKKVSGAKEKDLCKYLPADSGGYIHHFTLRKLKHKQPQKLGSMIEKFIIKTEYPASVPPKSRAPRGSRKRTSSTQFTLVQLEKILRIAKQVEDKELITLLSPKVSINPIKKKLISSIRQGKADQNLWNTYVDCLNQEQILNS